MVGLVAQGVLGWILAEDDFGVFAVAVGLGSLVYALPDGGIRRYLLERGPYASPNVRANAVWYSVVVSVVAALALALLAPLGGWLFDEQSVRSILLISAAAVLLGFFVPISRALLEIHGGVRTAELFDGAAIVVHYVLVALFAALDFGAVSLVLPLLIINPLLSLGGWLAVRRMGIPFGHPTSRGLVRIAVRSRPVVLMMAAVGLLRYGQFGALGLGASADVVGFYFFAHQLAMSSVLWLTNPVRRILVPTFASMHGDEWRRRRAALDSFLVSSLLIGTVPLLFAALARPIEGLVWRGRWEEAVLPIQILGASMAFEVVVVVALMLFQSEANARRRLELVAWRGAGLVVVMGLAGWLAPEGSLGTIALTAGGYLAVSGLVIGTYVLKALDQDLVKVGRGIGAVYLLTGSATVLALLAQLVLDDLVAWVQLSAAAAVFLLVVFVGSRTFFESRLRRVATVIERTTGNTLLQKTLRGSRSAQSHAPE